MSLINQMLRDLESRRDGDTDHRQARAVGRSTAGRRSPLLIVGLLALLLLLLAAVYALVPLERSLGNERITEPSEAAPEAAAVVPEVTEEEATRIAPVHLLAIETVATRDGQRLRLDFDGDSAYRRRSAANDRLVVEVDARLSEASGQPLPPAVRSLETRDLGEGRTRLQLQLESGWQAGPLYLEENAAGGDRLALVLQEAPAEVDTRSTEPSSTIESGPAPEPEPALDAGTQPEIGSPRTADEPDPPLATESDVADTSGEMLRQRREPSDEERIAAAWSEALEALQQRRLERAEIELERVLELQAAHVEARDALAEILLDQGRVEAADELLAASLSVAALPAAEQGYFARQRARLWLDRGRLERAVEALEAVYPERDAAPESAALLAGLRYRQGEYHQAAALYETLLADSPEQGPWWMGLGLAREGLGDFSGASEAYRQALASDGLGPSVQNYLQQRLRELESQP